MIAFRLGSIHHAATSIPRVMPFTFSQFCLVFGIVSIVLGGLGFARAGSRASLIAGGISGVLLIVSTYLHQPLGTYVGLAVCGLLLGRFLPGFLKTRTLYPAGLMALLALIGTVMGVMSVVR